MIRLAALLVRDDLRTEPARAAITALLLTVAGLVTATGVDVVLAFVVGLTIAAAAAAGAVGAHEHRLSVLDRNGAGLGPSLLTAVGTILPPAVVALALTGVAAGPLAAALDRTAPTLGDLAAVTLLGPIVATAVATWALTPRRPWGALGWTLVVLLVVVSALTVVVPLVVAAVVIGRWAANTRSRWRTPAVAALTVVSILTLAGIAASLGGSTTFFDLGLGLVVCTVPLVAALAYLGSTTVAGLAALTSRTGPTARLAGATIAARRRQLGALAAAVGVLAAAAGAEGVVGASFGERERRRLDAPPVYVGRAGTDPGQVIVVTSWAEPDQAATAVATARADHPTVPVVAIDRLGRGGTQTVPNRAASQGFLDFSPLVDPAPTVQVSGERTPNWVGVASAEDLRALGLDDAADAIAAGQVAVLNDTVGVVAGHVTVRTHIANDLTDDQAGRGEDVRLPAVRIDLDEPALLLPGAVMGPEVAAGLDEDLTPARIVVGGHGSSADDPEVVAAFQQVHRDTRPTLAPETDLAVDFDGDGYWDRGRVELEVTPTAGSYAYERHRGSRQNDVPILSDTAAEGRERLIGLAGLAVLVTLAATALTLARSRGEDALLEVQGAPAAFRVRTAAVQAAVVAAAGSVLGLVAGIGIPVIAMAVYNGRNHEWPLLDVPIVVPPLVIAVMVALPVVAAALAAVIVWARPRPSTRLLADAAA